MPDEIRRLSRNFKQLVFPSASQHAYGLVTKPILYEFLQIYLFIWFVVALLNASSDFINVKNVRLTLMLFEH